MLLFIEPRVEQGDDGLALRHEQMDAALGRAVLVAPVAAAIALGGTVHGHFLRVNDDWALLLLFPLQGLLERIVLFRVAFRLGNRSRFVHLRGCPFRLGRLRDPSEEFGTRFVEPEVKVNVVSTLGGHELALHSRIVLSIDPEPPACVAFAGR